jgi:nucleotide-binding universal stress UspA family protein
VFGSVSTHLLHACSNPILIAHRGPAAEHDRIRVVVGADGSPAAMSAIDTLLALTDPDRIELEVRATLQTPTEVFAAYPGAVVPARYVTEALKKAREVTSRNLERSLQRLRRAGFMPHGSLGSGWAANDLLDLATRSEADLVVVGARGVGRLERLALGSVSSHVARHAPATLVAHAEQISAVTDDRIGDPDGDVRRTRYAVRWR